MNQHYEQKYLKYKFKYLQLQNQLGGGKDGEKTPVAAAGSLDEEKTPVVAAAAAATCRWRRLREVLEFLLDLAVPEQAAAQLLA